MEFLSIKLINNVFDFLEEEIGKITNTDVNQWLLAIHGAYRAALAALASTDPANTEAMQAIYNEQKDLLPSISIEYAIKIINDKVENAQTKELIVKILTNLTLV